MEIATETLTPLFAFRGLSDEDGEEVELNDVDLEDEDDEDEDEDDAAVDKPETNEDEPVTEE